MNTATTIAFTYTHPGHALGQAWASVPPEPAPEVRAHLRESLLRRLQSGEAALIAHYYTHPDMQDLAEASGGIVADSLEMARFGARHQAQRLIVAGVRFMGETAKILSPAKRVFMPDLDAQCSLDLGCPAAQYTQWRRAHPDHVAVVYANTSAEVKAESDWVVTSSCALEIVRSLKAQGKKILFAPDRYLGQYIREQTGAEMLIWQGACIVHEEFKAFELAEMKKAHPGAKVLAHPESSGGVLALADFVGSTSAILKAARTSPAQTFIVATDAGLMHQLRRLNAGKTFLEAPPAGSNAACKSCAHCPWMAMNHLGALQAALDGSNEILLQDAVIARARQPIERMLDFTAISAKASMGGMTPGLGAA